MKLTRKILSGATALVMSIGLLSISAFAETLVYDGADDLNAMPDNPGAIYPAYNDEVGADGAGRIALAGGPTLFIGDGGRGLGISGRANEWDSIDVLLGDLDIGDYRLDVVFNANEELTFNIKEADGPWDSLGTAKGTSDTTVSINFTIDEKGKCKGQNRFRLNLTDDPDLKNYYVKSIKIYSLGGDAAEAPAGGGATTAPATGNATVAAIVSVMALAGAAAVLSRKRK
jgi:hypothetical protein